MSLEAGRRCRIVITWDQPRAYGSYRRQPSADLDLLIQRDGSTVASSVSWCSNVEVVDFTPTVTGTYTLRVKQYRCDRSPAHLGYAWHQEL